VELSLKSEYSILALIELASNYGTEQPLQIRQIASQQNIPDRYLEQLLASLRRYGFVKSQRGAKGGYVLAREPRSISVLEVIRCVEGTDPLAIAAKNDNAPENLTGTSVVQEIWQSAQQAAAKVLDSCSLKDLCDREYQRRLSATMYYI
jgi:Rrf2 family transcriptional regulator, cysteine metabolism repressor